MIKAVRKQDKMLVIIKMDVEEVSKFYGLFKNSETLSSKFITS